ncbi:SRPBCC family protein [Flexivirga alba]|uniref:SRPBCC family protein n=1 Tax=Flexivirga alba TaxID=702742 RepID=A0ABW2AH91_9MICO
MSANLEVFIEINASPMQVWDVVSDLKRMPQWSPQAKKVIVRGGPLKLGSAMINFNRRDVRFWATRSRIVAFDPGKRIAWEMKENHATWSFDLVSLDDNTRTRLVERRDVSAGVSKASRLLIDKFLGGEESFDKELTTGMRQTLQGIRTSVESGS